MTCALPLSLSCLSVSVSLAEGKDEDDYQLPIFDSRRLYGPVHQVLSLPLSPSVYMSMSMSLLIVPRLPFPRERLCLPASKGEADMKLVCLSFFCLFLDFFVFVSSSPMVPQLAFFAKKKKKKKKKRTGTGTGGRRREDRLAWFDGLESCNLLCHLGFLVSPCSFTVVVVVVVVVDIIFLTSRVTCLFLDGFFFFASAMMASSLTAYSHGGYRRINPVRNMRWGTREKKRRRRDQDVCFLLSLSSSPSTFTLSASLSR
ncbi:hypothetical protein TRV_00805 [Trichophyton verrucosum HKI 0517]|uniref:Transmembrane protein n=1 Tax=Trichophyton verrucosum (strain HKI 0517) TaxID=663202 RepID=D4D158_TRIVH|nr:uncharacterized protein TRV_00805 [Trichophyton verrucosum HKI 0517]EFE44390.1 hypothetical protein TRV_00805 [Trichophyton verrucosum HKI 0517]